MNPNNIPQQLANIPYGQIFILTSPYKGISFLHIRMLKIIRGVSRDYHPECIVQTLAVDNPKLWNCVVCKVKSEDGDEMIIANLRSLLEMLCELWGLDLETISDGGRLWQIPRSLLVQGEKHFIKIPIVTDNGESPLAKVGDTPTMGMLSVYSSKAGALGDIRSILQSGFNQHLGISALDLMTLYDEEEKRKRATWYLDIKIGKGKTGYNKDWKIVDKVKCEIFLVDPSGKPHQLDIKAQSLALYLTFILFQDGIKLSDIQNDEFYTIFKTMCERLPYINEIPEDGKTLKKYAGDKRNKILKQITDIIKDDQYLIKQFAIEGYKGEPYKVAASTDEHREAIKNAFGIE